MRKHWWIARDVLNACSCLAAIAASVALLIAMPSAAFVMVRSQEMFDPAVTFAGALFVTATSVTPATVTVVVLLSFAVFVS